MSRRTKGALAVALGVLLAMAVGLLIASLRVNATAPSEDAARLQAMAAAAGLLASIVLAVVTAAYVLLTNEMVAETRETRLDAIRPALALRIDPLSAGHVVFAVVSVGRGTAMNLDLCITFHAAAQGGHSHVVHWRAASLSPGDAAQFMAKDASGQVQLQIASVVGLFSAVTIEGTLKDVAGRDHLVDVRFDDLSGWHSRLQSQRHVDAPMDALRKSVDSVAKVLGDILNKLP
ncbi:MAG: hypothetical protein ACT452_13335 [Microthrixaceae bacterium]